MIQGLLWLLGCQLVGEVIVRTSGVTIPGPVVGMVVLFVLLQLRRPAADAPVLRTSDVLLRHLQLFFVPAGVGIIVYLGVVRADAVPILGAIVGSWLAGLLVVGWLMSAWLGRAHHD